MYTYIPYINNVSLYICMLVYMYASVSLITDRRTDRHADTERKDDIDYRHHDNFGACRRIGWFDTFQPEGRGFESRSIRHVGTLDKSFTRSCLWRLGIKPGRVSVLCRERIWVVVDLKRRYRNGLDKWMNEWITWDWNVRLVSPNSPDTTTLITNFLKAPHWLKSPNEQNMTSSSCDGCYHQRYQPSPVLSSAWRSLTSAEDRGRLKSFLRRLRWFQFLPSSVGSSG